MLTISKINVQTMRRNNNIIVCFKLEAQERQYEKPIESINKQIKKQGLMLLLVMTYAAETWAHSETQLESVATAQRKIERQLFDKILLDHKTNTLIRQRAQIEDIRYITKESKHRWAGHLANIIIRQLMDMEGELPFDNQRGRGRTSRRRRDETAKSVRSAVEEKGR